MAIIKRTSQAHLDLVEIGLRIAEDNPWARPADLVAHDFFA